MEFYVLIVVAFANIDARKSCGPTKIPLEVGKWRHDLTQMDSAVVENKPVAISEGQVYVYENYFPNHIIKYIHVDNLAVKTCGASASIKSGGVGKSSVLVILQAASNQEIRTVVDIWGVKTEPTRVTKPPLPKEKLKNMRSLYLFKDWRTVNHNNGKPFDI